MTPTTPHANKSAIIIKLYSGHKGPINTNYLGPTV